MDRPPEGRTRCLGLISSGRVGAPVPGHSLSARHGRRYSGRLHGIAHRRTLPRLVQADTYPSMGRPPLQVRVRRSHSRAMIEIG